MPRYRPNSPVEPKPGEVGAIFVAYKLGNVGTWREGPASTPAVTMMRAVRSRRLPQDANAMMGHTRGSEPRRQSLVVGLALIMVLTALPISSLWPTQALAVPSLASAVSTSSYMLANSDGVNWQELDAAAKLRLSATPSANQSALLSANADLFTDTVGVNQDLGIFVSDNAGTDALIAWKESGGTGTYSPNVTYVQTLFSMTAGHTYLFKLEWKTSIPSGAKIYAGAGPIPGLGNSPTSLVAKTFPSGVAPNFVFSTNSYQLANSDGSTWKPIDINNLIVTLSPGSTSTAVLGASADLWTATAGFNQDLGIFVSDNGSADALVAWKESGGGGTYSPGPAFVKATYAMTGGHNYVFSLKWKTSISAPPGATIFAGAGPISGKWSPTSLFAETTAPAASPYATVSTSSYNLPGSDGATWQPMDTALDVSVSGSVMPNVLLGANADLWTDTSGYNQDIGIFVSDNGGPDALVAWKESGGRAGTFSPNAAFAQATYTMTSGHSYVFRLKWKTNTPAPAGARIYAGAGPISGRWSPTRLTAEAPPTAPTTLIAPPAPTNVTATPGQYSAVVHWTQPATSASGISYVVTPYLGGQAQPTVTVGGGNSATVGNLHAAQSYTFTVTAKNSTGSAVSAPSPLPVTPLAQVNGLGQNLFLYSVGHGTGRVMYDGGWARHTPLSASLPKWTIEGYIWNLSYTGVTGGSMGWGLLSGSSSYPIPTAIAGLQWTGAAGAGSFVWPGGSSPFSGSQSGSTPTHVVLEYDGTNVTAFINGVQSFTQAASSAAIPSGSWPGFMDNTQLTGESFDEFKVSNRDQYPANTAFTPGRAVVDSATAVLYHFDDYAAVGQVASQYVYINNRGPYDVPSVFGDSTATPGGDADLFAEYTCGSLCSNATTYVMYSSTQFLSPSALIGGGFPWICRCQRHTARPVNTATGEFWHTFDDLTIPGRGVQVDLQRTYSSALASQTGRFGFGWNDSYQTHVVPASGSPPPTLTVAAGNGSSTVFGRVGAHPGGGDDYAAPMVLASVFRAATGTFTLTDKSGTVYGFDTQGNLASETDRNNYTTTLAYPGGKLTTVTAPGGITLTLAYDTANPSLVHSVTDSAGRVFTYDYDPTTKDLLRVTDAGHNTGANLIQGVWTFGYDSSHRMTSLQDPNCTANPTTCAYTPSKDTGLGVVHGTTNVYDASSRIIRQYDDRGVVTEFSYTTDSDPVLPTSTTTITEHPTPSTSLLTVDTYRGGVLASETKASGTPLAATWQYAYDPTSLGLTMTIDPSGRATTTTRDALANPLTITDPKGGVETITYTTDGFNQVWTDQDPVQVQAGTSIKTTNTYDTKGNLTQVSRPLDNPAGTLVVHYNRTDATHPDDVITKQDGDLKTWRYTYDGARGYLLTSEDPLSPADVTHYGYDTAGRLSCQVAARGNTTCPNTPANAFETKFTHDASGGRTDVLAPLGHHSTALFDRNGNRTSATDANSNTTTYVYDSIDRMTSVVQPDSSQEQTTYDDVNNVLSQSTVLNATTYFRFDYTYDSLNHLATATDNANPRRQTGYSYNAQSELLSMTDAQNQTTSNTYDAAGLLQQVTYSDGITPSAAYAYDADGQRLSMTDWTGTSTYTWDSLHRLKQMRNGNLATVTYGYDFRNDLISITYPGSTGTALRQFDDVGRLKHVQDWLTGSAANSGVGFTYDPDGNLKTATYPNGVVATSTYDNADQLQQIADTGSGALFNYSYSAVPRDGLGQLKSDGATSYGYDTKNRLSSLNGGANTWTYDPANDLTKSPTASSLTYDNANQLQTMVSGAGTTTFRFDQRGNRISQSPPTGPSVTYGYDQANRITSYNSTAAYAYNGDGLRMSKTTTAATAQYAYDASGALPLLIQAAATTAGTTTTTSYLTGPGGLPVEQISSAGVATFFHQDQLGSTRLITSGSAPGTPVGSYTYDPFGAITINSGTAPAFGFAGQIFDTESGLVYLRARYYDPSTGQFISRDSITSTTQQPYSYSFDNPLNLTDASGMDVFGDFQNFVIGAAHATHTERAVGVVAHVASAYYGVEHDAAAWVGQHGDDIASSCGAAALVVRPAAGYLAACSAIAGSASVAYKVSNGALLDAAVTGTLGAIGAKCYKSEPVGQVLAGVDAVGRMGDFMLNYPKTHPGQMVSPNAGGMGGAQE